MLQYAVHVCREIPPLKKRELAVGETMIRDIFVIHLRRVSYIALTFSKPYYTIPRNGRENFEGVR
jgi:hypothetical protein